MMPKCPKPYHCPICQSHPQPDTIRVVEELVDGVRRRTNRIRLTCYYGHDWEEAEMPIVMIPSQD